MFLKSLPLVLCLVTSSLSSMSEFRKCNINSFALLNEDSCNTIILDSVRNNNLDQVDLLFRKGLLTKDTLFHFVNANEEVIEHPALFFANSVEMIQLFEKHIQNLNITECKSINGSNLLYFAMASDYPLDVIDYYLKKDVNPLEKITRGDSHCLALSMFPFLATDDLKKKDYIQAFLSAGFPVLKLLQLSDGSDELAKWISLVLDCNCQLRDLGYDVKKKLAQNFLQAISNDNLQLVKTLLEYGYGQSYKIDKYIFDAKSVEMIKLLAGSIKEFNLKKHKVKTVALAKHEGGLLNLLQNALIDNQPLEVIAYYLMEQVSPYEKVIDQDGISWSAISLFFCSGQEKTDEEIKALFQVFLDSGVSMASFLKLTDKFAANDATSTGHLARKNTLAFETQPHLQNLGYDMGSTPCSNFYDAVSGNNIALVKALLEIGYYPKSHDGKKRYYDNNEPIFWAKSIEMIQLFEKHIENFDIKLQIDKNNLNLLQTALLNDLPLEVVDYYLKKKINAGEVIIQDADDIDLGKTAVMNSMPLARVARIKRASENPYGAREHSNKNRYPTLGILKFMIKDDEEIKEYIRAFLSAGVPLLSFLELSDDYLGFEKIISLTLDIKPELRSLGYASDKTLTQNFYEAVLNDNLILVKALFEMGIKPKDRRYKDKSIFFAKSVEMIQLFEKYYNDFKCIKNSNGQNLLLNAQLNNFSGQIIGYYINKGISPYEFQAGTNLSGLTYFIHKKKQDENPEMIKEYIKAFLDAGVPLIQFLEISDTHAGYEQVISLALDVNQRLRDLGYNSKEKLTQNFYDAVQIDNIPLARALFEIGINPKKQNYKDKSIFFAKSVEMIKLFKRYQQTHKIKEERNSEGYNLLHNALRYQMPLDVVTYYLSSGVDLYNVIPNTDKSALVLLLNMEKENEEMKKYLQAFFDAGVSYKTFTELFNSKKVKEKYRKLVTELLPEKAHTIFDIIRIEHEPAIKKEHRPKSTDDSYLEYLKVIFEEITNSTALNKFILACAVLKMANYFPYIKPLDTKTRENLTLLVGNQAIPERCLANRINRTVTSGGEAILCSQLAHPLANLDDLQKRQRLIVALKELYNKPNNRVSGLLQICAKSEGAFVSFSNTADEFLRSLKLDMKNANNYIVPTFGIAKLKEIKNKWNNHEIGLYFDAVKELAVPLVGLAIKFVSTVGGGLKSIADGAMTIAEGAIKTLTSFTKLLSKHISQLGLTPSSMELKPDGFIYYGLKCTTPELLAETVGAGIGVESFVDQVGKIKTQVLTSWDKLKMMQKILIIVRHFVEALQAMQAELNHSQDPDLKSLSKDLFPAIVNKENLAELINNLLKKDTFKDSSSSTWFYHWGRVKKTYLLMHECFQDFAKPYAALAMVDFLSGSIRLLNENPNLYCMPQYINPLDRLPGLFATNYWNPLLSGAGEISRNTLNFGISADNIISAPRSIIVTGLSGKGKSYNTTYAMLFLALMSQSLGVVSAESLSHTPFEHFLTHINCGTDLVNNQSYGQNTRNRAMYILKIIAQAQGFCLVSMDEPWTGGDHPEICILAAMALIQKVGLSLNSVGITTTHHINATNLAEVHQGAFANYKTGKNFTIEEGIGETDPDERLIPYEAIDPDFLVDMEEIKIGLAATKNK